MKWSAKVRAIIACFGLVCCFTGFSARLAYLQVDQHEKFERLAAEKHVKKQPIFAGRGEIRDVNGELLATNEPLSTVVADGSVIAAGKAEPEEIAALLADLLKIPKSELTSKIDTQRKYVVLKRSVPEAETAAITKRFEEFQARTKKPVRGIFFEPDTRRVYPNNEVLCHVLGFMGQKQPEGADEPERMGVEGIERSMDKWLRGYDGFRYIERDRTGKEIVPYRGQERSARDGYDVRLTIDMRLQHIVETELEELYKKYRPEFTTAIMMDPRTGRILAMANRPCFDPNDLSRGKNKEGKSVEIPPQKMKNCAVINIVEPGSVFKIVPVSAALNDKLVTLDTMIGCEGGHWNYGGKILKDHGGGDHPDLSVFDVIVHSSNIGSAKLAMRLGEQRFYEYVRNFGFGERTGINLPGEVAGIVHSPKSSGWNKLTIARMPMGQGVCVTPIQMVTAMSVIANGGKLMMPQIVDSVVDKDGASIVHFDPVPLRQVVGPRATAELRSALKEVVSKKGTAFAATIPGYTAGGKTGTAQIAKPGGGGYYDNRFVTSFVGFFPANDPQIVCLVMVDDAKAAENLNYGGLIAGPAFSRIGEQAAHYLNLPPDAPTDPQPAPQAIAKLTKSDR
ncbi:MAG: penicillin-binding protein 2 [Verrucomicrobia bacterium]|nr:penicillin-binding protein 2 [Verrucomicrobiota bacterium]